MELVVVEEVEGQEGGADKTEQAIAGAVAAWEARGEADDAPQPEAVMQGLAADANLSEETREAAKQALGVMETKPAAAPKNGALTALEKLRRIPIGDWSNETLSQWLRAIGLQRYAQVTSPIRRFSDFVLHRQIKAVLRGKEPVFSVEEMGYTYFLDG